LVRAVLSPLAVPLVLLVRLVRLLARSVPLVRPDQFDRVCQRR